MSSKLTKAKHKYVRKALKDCNNICPICHRQMQRAYPTRGDFATIDHIKPKLLGGRNKRTNYQLICRDCNQKKGSIYKPEKDKRPYWVDYKDVKHYF